MQLLGTFRNVAKRLRIVVYIYITLSYFYGLFVAFHEFILDRSTLRGSLTFRRLMSYIYGAPILDVSRSHTTTQHSR